MSRNASEREDAVASRRTTASADGEVARAAPLLEVRDLSVSFGSAARATIAADDVSFTIGRGETVGLVGESGCGKSTTALAILRLLPRRNARIDSGEIWFDGVDLVTASASAMQQVRGGRIGLVSQDALTGLNPLEPVGTQIAESVRLHLGLSRSAARARAEEVLHAVGIPRARERMDDYPHEFSGGMRQRVMIGIAIACEPDLILADEPTTALDVTVQAQIIELLGSLSAEAGTAVLLITHNFGIAARLCDRINVMYAGRIVESGLAEDVFESPQMPYTRGLLRCIPRLDDDLTEPLRTIPGLPPKVIGSRSHCWFAGRCEHARDVCRSRSPELTPREADQHFAGCFGTEADGWVR